MLGIVKAVLHMPTLGMFLLVALFADMADPLDLVLRPFVLCLFLAWIGACPVPVGDTII